jgi:hypothetical protein
LKHPDAHSDLDPYHTSCRWHRRDKEEQDARYLAFSFDALCRKIVELCPGTNSIASYEKKEGSSNRIFIFSTDDGKRVVAKVPFPHAGASRLITNSEVATMSFREFDPTKQYLNENLTSFQ